MWRLFETADKQLLQKMSNIIKEIYTEETDVLTKLQQLVN